MAQQPGHPRVTVRLHPEVVRRLKERAESHRGKRSGMAALIRDLIYEAVDFPGSKEWERQPS